MNEFNYDFYRSLWCFVFAFLFVGWCFIFVIGINNFSFTLAVFFFLSHTFFCDNLSIVLQMKHFARFFRQRHLSELFLLHASLLIFFVVFQIFVVLFFFYFHLWSPGTRILFSGKFAFLSILSSNVLFFLDMVSLFSCSIFFLDFSDKYPYLWTPHFFYS